MSFRQSVNKWGAIAAGLLVAFGAVKTAIGYFGESGSAAAEASANGSPTRSGTGGMIDGFVIAMCHEPIRLSDCRVESGTITPTCTVESTSPTVFDDNLKVWSYTAEGVLMGELPLLTYKMLPGQKKRMQLQGTGSNPVKKLVVCSVDPEHPVARDRITVVGASSSN